MKEREIIDLLASLAPGKHSDLLVGIGDDCAVIRKNADQSWLVTMDTLIEGVHFDLTWHAAELLGRKTVAVNVSDIAAMGGRPLFVFLSLGLPAEFDPQWLTEFSRGFAAACSEFGCLLAGGDTVRSPNGIMLTLTVLGEAESGRVLLRSGARAGDVLWVSGKLGRAAAGLELCRLGMIGESGLQDLVQAHLDPRPRLELGRRVAQEGLAHAMMDLSDGLATDIAHMCLRSGVGIVLDAGKLPVSDTLREAARQLGLDPLHWMVAGGEDFELAFAAAPDRKGELLALGRDLGVPLTAVGNFDTRKGVRLLRSGQDGTGPVQEDISFAGFDHFPAGDNAKKI
jgi:thiamine-monophosphate kinase